MVRVRHQRARGLRAAIALTTACLFFACGLLAMHHAADVSHGRDADGAATHGPSTDCHDGAPTTHLHEVPEHDDLGTCHLTDLLHTHAQTFAAVSTAIAPRTFLADPPRLGTDFVQPGLLLAAPKTSPPALA